MLQLLQIMNYLVQCKCSSKAIEQQFTALEQNKITLEAFLDSVGVEFSPSMIPYLENAVPKWRSAWAVTKMRTGRK